MTELQSRIRAYLADPNAVEDAFELGTLMLPKGLIEAIAADDYAETGRLICYAVRQELRERAESEIEAEQERAEAMDTALHAEEGPPDLMAMFRGLMPCSITGDPS